MPLIGCGDWNDGFSRVGQQGEGESVWLAFFIEYVLQRMLPICSSRGDQARVARYTDYRKRLADAVNTAGWDGAWYRRAYYDNGQPIGSSESEECQIDALVQAWAVLSKAAPQDRAEMAMRAAEERLVCQESGMIRLLTPPFDRTPNDPGYIKGYLPGIRENGGQYTHGVLWLVRAVAEMGRGTQAVELLKMLSPVSHSNSKQQAQIYQTEPYVVAADVYGEPPHVGRGGWTWYTGSAGWMFRVAVESIFGVSTEGGHTLVVNPSISSDWPQCRMTYRLPGGNTCYDILIENPEGKEHGVSAAMLDGQPMLLAERRRAHSALERRRIASCHHSSLGRSRTDLVWHHVSGRFSLGRRHKRLPNRRLSAGRWRRRKHLASLRAHARQNLRRPPWRHRLRSLSAIRRRCADDARTWNSRLSVQHKLVARLAARNWQTKSGWPRLLQSLGRHLG